MMNAHNLRCHQGNRTQSEEGNININSALTSVPDVVESLQAPSGTLAPTL